jgi:hypothetical protein
MQVLLDRTFERTADRLLRELGVEAYRESQIEIWLFEDTAKRQALQAGLLALGVHAKVLSAYKPLVHFFLDEVHAEGLQRVRIVYPCHAACVANRFLLEAYPLTDLFPDVDVAFTQAIETSTESYYQVKLVYNDRAEDHRVFAPNVLGQDFLGLNVYAPSAWLKVKNHGQISSTAIQADYQQVYQAVMDVVDKHDWGQTEPYFDRLTVVLNLPGIERKLSCGQEIVSTSEAMHEEVYFSLLEFFQSYSGRKQGSRGLQPGQIVPDIRLDNGGVPHAKVMLEPSTAFRAEAPRVDPVLLNRTPVVGESVRLDDADRPLTLLQVERALQTLSGQHFAFWSCRGRAVNGVYHRGNAPAVFISGAQHANETSGVVGALRAAQQLGDQVDAHFAIVPLENPDGYAMHQALCATHPTHMHHAARYTALGDDLEYRERAPWFERAARDHAFEISRSQLHLNLHGYPAHEWTRPCTGYLPRGFELWSIPKGFFLILRYKSDYKEAALTLLEHVTSKLAEDARLMAYNAAQLHRYKRYSATQPFQVRHGIPYTATQVPNQTPGVTLITEFPDETIYGDEYVFAHTVQTRTVLLASNWWWMNFKGESNESKHEAD